MSDDKHLIEVATGREELLRGNFLHAVRDTVRLRAHAYPPARARPGEGQKFFLRFRI